MKKYIIMTILLILLLISCKKTQELDTKSEASKKTEDIRINRCIIKMFEGNINILDENGKKLPSEVGLALKMNWIINTEDNSMVELEVGKLQTILIKENSSIVINKLFLNNEQENTSIKINSGSIFTDSKKLTEGSSFEIKTKSITVGIRGTSFSVTEEDGEAKVLVEEGEVKVKKNIVLKELEQIKEKDEKLYKELKDELEEETIVKKDEKLEVKEKELEEEAKSISKSLENIRSRLNKGEKITAEDKEFQNIKNRKRIYRRNRIDKEDKESYLNRKSPKSRKIRGEKIKDNKIKDNIKEKNKEIENRKESTSNTSATTDGRILLKVFKFSDSFLVDDVKVANEKFSKIIFETDANDITFNRVRIIYSDKKDVVFSKNFSISKENNRDGILTIDNSKEVVTIRVTLKSKMNNSPKTQVFVYGIK